jgi:hypothetical protein
MKLRTGLLTAATFMLSAFAAPTTASAIATYSFRSQPDLSPPRLTVKRHAPGAAPGYLFVAPKGSPRNPLLGNGARVSGGIQQGPVIADDQGHLVWFKPMPPRTIATNFQVIRWQGQPALLWWQGKQVNGWGVGHYVVADQSYRTIAEIRAGNGLSADLHDILITPRGTALITIYRPTEADLSRVGGEPRGRTIEGVLQEIDLATGAVLFEWRSLDHVPVTESYRTPANYRNKAFDYFHINAVDIDDDGNLLLCARNTRAIYKVDRGTGKIIWRLGGKQSDFEMPPNSRFAWQHDVQRQSDGTITIFDNGAAPPVRKRSRVLVFEIEEKTKRATLERVYRHPDKLLARSQGNAQTLAGGNLIVGWGAQPYVTEFSRSGATLFDARMPEGINSYRAYRWRWEGRPAGQPTLVMAKKRGTPTAHVSWNGATEVARWQLLGGRSPADLQPIRTVDSRRKFERAIPARGQLTYFAARAKAADGTTLGESRVVQIGE